MTVYSITNLKGGCSKSMTAVHLATYLQNQGFSVALIDCDRQQSSAKWLAALDSTIQVFSSDDIDDIEDAILELGDNYEAVVVDTGSNATDIMDMVLRNSDHLLIPTQPSEMDADSTELTIKRVVRAKRVNKSLTATLFLARVFKNTVMQRQTVEKFTNYDGVDLSETQIPNTQRLVKIINTSQTAFNAAGCKDLGLLFSQLFSPLLGGN